MRTSLMRWMVGWLVLTGPSWAQQIPVLTATATSSARPSTEIGCLLAPDCKGLWSAGSDDAGANEGVYVQLERPVAVDELAVTWSDQVPEPAFTLSVNGMPVRRTAKAQAVSDHGRTARQVQYALPGLQLKSFFIRLGVRQGGRKPLALYAIRLTHRGKPVNLRLPVTVAATVTASSQLAPQAAYQPAHLFDSRYDFAWSTDGKTSQGTGESVEVTFARPQNISGLIVWNGYQRSEMHYRANGRITKLVVEAQQHRQAVALRDTLGAQQISLPEPLRDVTRLRMTIAGTKVGSKYKDVLLSELRFVDDQGRIVLPVVEGFLPQPSPATAPLVGRSLSSVVCSVSSRDISDQRALRLRRDGSFVIYARLSDETGMQADHVLEGNWDQTGDGVRIFGKRYAETVLRTEYEETKRSVAPSIFQSDLKINHFRNLKPAEKQELVQLIWARVGSGPAAYGGPGKLVFMGAGGQIVAEGDNKDVLLKNLLAAFESLNPWVIRSPVLADAMLPSDDVGSCE